MANNSFIFYESWSKFIDKKDRETAKELVYQIYRIGLDKDLDTDNEEIIDIIDALKKGKIYDDGIEYTYLDSD